MRLRSGVMVGQVGPFVCAACLFFGCHLARSEPMSLVIDDPADKTRDILVTWNDEEPCEIDPKDPTACTFRWAGRKITEDAVTLNAFDYGGIEIDASKVPATCKINDENQVYLCDDLTVLSDIDKTNVAWIEWNFPVTQYQKPDDPKTPPTKARWNINVFYRAPTAEAPESASELFSQLTAGGLWPDGLRVSVSTDVPEPGSLALLSLAAVCWIGLGRGGRVQNNSSLADTVDNSA